MLRSAIAGLLIYSYGHPGLDAARPGLLDRPLASFHRDINTVVGDAYRTLSRFDHKWVIASVKGYADHLHAQARAND